MSSTTRFIVRVVLRLLQLCCLYFLFHGIANIDPMITAIKAWLNGDASVADVCWKILPVTAEILPALGVFAVVQVLLGVIKPTTHDPSEPWMANPMWADRHIRLNNKGTFWAIVWLVMVYLGIIVPFCFAIQKTPFLVLCGIFGVAIMLFARVFWLNRKWNTAELRMADLPGVIGGPFSGVAILQEAFPAGTAFDLCLKCEAPKLERKPSGVRPSRSTRRYRLMRLIEHLYHSVSRFPLIAFRRACTTTRVRGLRDGTWSSKKRIKLGLAVPCSMFRYFRHRSAALTLSSTMNWWRHSG
jgi:hypothetical protein